MHEYLVGKEMEELAWLLAVQREVNNVLHDAGHMWRDVSVKSISQVLTYKFSVWDISSSQCRL